VTRCPWEDDFWTPEPVFRGKKVFCCASGPSFTPEVADRLRGHHVLVINSSYRLAPWADAWFFTDSGVYDRFRREIEEFPGLIVTHSRKAKRELPRKVNRVKGIWRPGFAPPGSDHIRQGRSSGHSAPSFLVTAASTDIVLVGYDMRTVHGREHCHDDYAGQTRDLEIYEREFIPAFAGWHADAQAIGVRIVNATPGSALREFPIVDLADEL
jgi:hypothetical protein